MTKSEREEYWEKVVKDKIADAKRRGSKKRGWVKCTKSWLTCSINYRMELGEQAVFWKLIVMADEYGSVPGLISDNDFRAMPHDYLAHLAMCSIEIFESVIKKSLADDSIFENGHGLFLTHFDDYQFTEYDRQIGYRHRKRESEKQRDEEDEKIVYKEDGSIDENETIICHQSLFKVRQALKGEVPCLEANKRLYRQGLKRLGIEK